MRCGARLPERAHAHTIISYCAQALSAEKANEVSVPACRPAKVIKKRGGGNRGKGFAGPTCPCRALNCRPRVAATAARCCCRSDCPPSTPPPITRLDQTKWPRCLLNGCYQRHARTKRSLGGHGSELRIITRAKPRPTRAPAALLSTFIWVNEAFPRCQKMQKSVP